MKKNYSYKVIMNPASISVTGKNNFHRLRHTYPQEQRAFIIAEGLTLQEADRLKDFYNNFNEGNNIIDSEGNVFFVEKITDSAVLLKGDGGKKEISISDVRFYRGKS